MAVEKATGTPEGGRAPADPEPALDPRTTEMNQPEGAVAREETPKTRTGNPCPHPLEERISPGDITICLHCMAILDRQADITLEGPERAGEVQVHRATHAA